MMRYLNINNLKRKKREMFCPLNYLILPSTGMSLSLLIEVAQGFFSLCNSNAGCKRS